MGTERRRLRLAQSIRVAGQGAGAFDENGIAGNEVHDAALGGWRASNAIGNSISAPTKKDLLDRAMKNGLDGPRSAA